MWVFIQALILCIATVSWFVLTFYFVYKLYKMVAAILDVIRRIDV